MSRKTRDLLFLPPVGREHDRQRQEDQHAAQSANDSEFVNSDGHTR
jgi:hypothetical protein